MQHVGRRRAGQQLVPNDVSGVLADGLVRVEARIEDAGHLVEVEERLADHGHLDRGTQTRRRGGPGQLSHHHPGLQLSHGGGLVARHQRGDLSLVLVEIEVRSPISHGHEHVGRHGSLALAHGSEESDEPVLQLRCHPYDHPEVDQSQAAVRRQEHVARVGVGVDEAVHEDLVEVGPEELLRQ